MNAISTLFAACFAPVRQKSSRRTVTLRVESLEERQVLSSSSLTLARPEIGSSRNAMIQPERMQADAMPPEGWYVAFRRTRGRWNVRGPFLTMLETVPLRRRLRAQGAQVRAPFYVEAPPAEQPVEPSGPVLTQASPSLGELRRRIIGLEVTIPYAAQYTSWPARRNGWLAEVQTAGSPQELANLIVELEASVRPEAKDPGWAQYRLFWRQQMWAAETVDDVEAGRHVFAEALLV